MESFQHFMTSFWNAITPIELIGVVCALLYSLLASYEKVWCWPFAIIGSAILAYINVQDHYTWQAALQVFYIGMGIYGWYVWVYGEKNAAPLEIISYPSRKILIVLLIGVPLTIAAGFISMHFNVDKPWLDSGLTVYSVIATWLLARKVIQNWLFWIVIDPLSILLYADDTRKRYLIAFLFLIYTVIAIFGYFKWRQQLKAQQAVA